MFKPSNYDNTKESGSYVPVALGGHHLVLMRVEETTSKTGKPMLAVALDFTGADSQPRYMSTEFADDIRPDKKWPKTGMTYIVILDKNGNCSRSFKSFVRCVERSNPGFEVQWGDNFGAQFKGKIVGGVYGDVETAWQGKLYVRRELRWFCDDGAVDTAKAPGLKEMSEEDKIRNGILPAAQTQVQAPAADIAGFVAVPAGAEEEIPF